MTADEWMAGKDAEPIMISLKDGYVSSQKKNELKVKKKANILARRQAGGSASSQGGGGGGGGGSSAEAEDEPEDEPMSLAQSLSSVSSQKRLNYLKSETDL